jgi:benzoyl-CoA reductase/2-hydroxyglutaryl-CoA dehydratase subunit BcrC/BadD/HgdB
MILPYFENLVTGIEARLQGGTEVYVARKTLALEIARMGVRLFSGEQRVAWCGVLAPFDLLNALGVVPCFAEFVGAMLSSTGAVEPMLALAEQEGYSTDCCSYHRAVSGAALQGLMPRPDFLVATSTPCAGGVAVLEKLARHFERDLFVINVPQGRDEGDVAHLAGQLRAMVDFVTAHTGQPLDRQRLDAAIDATNRTRALLLETYKLASAVPSPARRRDLYNFGLVIALLLGTGAGVETARVYRDEFARKVAAGTAGVPGERVRLMWLQNRVQFKSPLEELLEQEHGAAVVVDELNDITWDPIDPADPYTGMARRILSIPLGGPVARRIERLQHLARLYRVHGALNPCHWGCRQGAGARGLVERGLREVGVPTLNLEVDCVDPRNFAPGQLTTRLEAFIELIHARRAREESLGATP